MTTNTADSNLAIAKREPAIEGEVVITSPAEFTSYLQQQTKRGAIVLSPMTALGRIPPPWTIVPAAVYLDLAEDSKDVYVDPLFCKGDDVAISKVGLRKIAHAAGMSWTTKREDTGTVRYYWAFSAIVTFTGFDGQKKEMPGNAEYDLTDGSPRVTRMINAAKRKNRDPAAQLEGARMHGLRNAEARAVNAAVRDFGLAQVYTRERLKSPFVVFNMVLAPNMADPDERRMVLASALGATNLLFGPPAVPALPVASGVVVDDDDENGGEGSSQREARSREMPSATTGTVGGSTPPATAVPLESEPEPEKPAREYSITSVMKQGSGYYLTTKQTEDTPLRTDDLSLAKAAKAAFEAKSTVHLELETRNGETFVLELQAVAEKL